MFIIDRIPWKIGQQTLYVCLNIDTNILRDVGRCHDECGASL